MLKAYSKKVYERKRALRKMELDYISKIDNEWSMKAYVASLNKNNKKIIGIIAVIGSLALGYTQLVRPILEVFS